MVFFKQVMEIKSESKAISCENLKVVTAPVIILSGLYGSPDCSQFIHIGFPSSKKACEIRSLRSR